MPVCDNNYSPPLCTNFYHDQGQTPGYPHGDGDCSPPACDVGTIPVGEYLFDFRSINISVNGQTFADWYVNEYHFGPTGAGNPLVGGFYVDDSWSNGGPTEMDGNCVKDMGLSASDVAEITAGYTWLTAILYEQIIARGKFIWDQTLNHDPYAPLNGDCPQPWVHKATCATELRALCTPDAPPQQNKTLLYGFSPGSCTGTNPTHLTEVGSPKRPPRSHRQIGPSPDPVFCPPPLSPPRRSTRTWLTFSSCEAPTPGSATAGAAAASGRPSSLRSSTATTATRSASARRRRRTAASSRASSPRAPCRWTARPTLPQSRGSDQVPGSLAI